MYVPRENTRERKHNIYLPTPATHKTLPLSPTPPATHDDTMSNNRTNNVAIMFEAETPIDFHAILDKIHHVYEIGYEGNVSHGDGKNTLYLQTCGTFLHGKVKKLLNEFPGVLAISPWSTLPDGVVQRSKRPYKTPGGNVGKAAVRTPKHIDIHINALGEEDVSHITIDDLSSLVGDESRIQAKKATMDTNPLLKRCIQDAACKHEDQRQRHWVNLWDMQHGNTGEESLGHRFGFRDQYPLSEFNYDSDDTVLGEEPTYEESGKQDKERSDKILDNYLLEANMHESKTAFIIGFERLLYKNPHNMNVRVPWNSGRFSFFRSGSWSMLRNSVEYFDVIILQRVMKALETVRALHDYDMHEFPGGQIERIYEEIKNFQMERATVDAANEQGAIKKYKKKLTSESTYVAETFNYKLAQACCDQNGHKIKKLKAVNNPAQSTYTCWDDLRK